MNAFDPTQFTLPSMQRDVRGRIFEGPVSCDKKLPRVARHKKLASDVWLVGYKGKKGCFSFRVFSSGDIDVALYPDEDPSDPNANIGGDARFITLKDRPGWGFEAIKELRKDMGLS